MIQQSFSMEEIVDRVLVMKEKEETEYSYRTYLPGIAGAERLNVTWREKICQWSYNVVDHFELSREVVAVSLNLFDRYLATCGNKCNGNTALLTSLTTLHIAIKLHDTKKIKISTLANLSRGQFGPKDIETMEWKILTAMGWKLHPPTQYAFVSHLLLFLPQEANPAIRKELFELSRYLTELAVCDSYFVEVTNSAAAFAAILNVMEDMNYSRLSAGIRERFLRDLAEHVGLSYRSPMVVAARERLRTMFVATSGSETMDATMASQTPQSVVVIKASESCDNASMAGSVSSFGSNGSFGRNRSRTNSVDSKGSCRYSPSPRRRHVVVASPITCSRARRSSSPIVALAH